MLVVSVLILLLAMFIIYHKLVVCSKCNIFYNKQSEFNNKIVQLMPNIHTSFCPTFWLSNHHAQTIFNVLLRFNPRHVSYVTEYFDFACGGKITLDWLVNNSDQWTEKTPLVCVLSGVCGGSQELEIKHFVNACMKSGFRVVVINYRGAQTELLTERFGLETPDLIKVFDYLKEKHPECKIFGVGFSLGSNVLCKYLGDVGTKTPLSAVVSVSNPFHLGISADKLLDQFVSKMVYDKVFTSKRKDLVLRHKHIYEKLEYFDEHRLRRVNSSKEFDNEVTRRIIGAETVDELYNQLSCVHSLPKISIPCFFLNSLDDPISCFSSIPYFQVKANPNLLLVTTERGGHVAWIDGILPFTSNSWMERTCTQYMQAFLKASEKVQ